MTATIEADQVRRRAEAAAWLAGEGSQPLATLLGKAWASARAGQGSRVGYSRKVFIPVTRLCRDVCAYCTFATVPKAVKSPYLEPEEVLAIARAGRAAGCCEALFTLGDKPELRWREAREMLARLGYATTLDYVAALCALVLRETGLLPHVNAGVMDVQAVAALRRVSVSQGLMLESVSPRLMKRGEAHHGSPDKAPAVRLATIDAAGRCQVPFTSGILIGIGETRAERIESLMALRDAHAAHGHLQEVIVQNFRAKTGTRMAAAAEPGEDEVLWTVAAARLILGPAMHVQVPPNLSYASFPRLLEAGLSDWGGISPVTPDHVNPEAPWPAIDRLRDATEAYGLDLVERLAIYPEYVLDGARWLDPALRGAVLAHSDASGYARADAWTPGGTNAIATRDAPVGRSRSPGTAWPARGDARRLDRLLARSRAGERLEPGEIVTLFEARGDAVDDIAAVADEVRASDCGDEVSYVVNRNINYTNVCSYACTFCAFSKGRAHEHLRGKVYDLALEEVARRAVEAQARGATEVCMQGGIHPDYTGETYLLLLRTVKEAAPALHVHAFSPLEVTHGAMTLGLSIPVFLERLCDAGLGSLPGTAAEILDDEIRAIICPDKVDTKGWLGVMEAAHHIGLRTTATIMFGHIESPRSWVRHLLHLRDMQARTRGFTEFVPLPFVHMEAPMYLRGGARQGPTWRETLLMHAVARLVLHPHFINIQASWVKAGADGAVRLLGTGVNDLGGTLMNESISRAAGAQHGQEMPPGAMRALIAGAGRVPRQRTTLYGAVDATIEEAGLAAAPLAEIVQTPFVRRQSARSNIPIRPLR